jgi:hypothetical protein
MKDLLGKCAADWKLGEVKIVFFLFHFLIELTLKEANNSLTLKLNQCKISAADFREQSQERYLHF